MGRIVLLTSALLIACSTLLAGPKCENAKLVLTEQKNVFDEATKTGQAKWNKKIAIPAKIKLLELFIKLDKDPQCEMFLKSIQKDVEDINSAK